MAIRDASTAASSHVIPSTEVGGSRRFIIGLWSASAGRPLRVASQVPVLARGAELSPNRDYFAWDPQGDSEKTD